MNIIELFLISLIFAIYQQVVLTLREEKEISSSAEHEIQRVNNLSNTNERQSKHVDLVWITKNIKDFTNNQHKPTINSQPLNAQSYQNKPLNDLYSNNRYSPNSKPFENENPFEDRPTVNHESIDTSNIQDSFNYYLPKAYQSSSQPPFTNEKRCLTPQNKEGLCKPIRECRLRPILTNLEDYIRLSCITGKLESGICCSLYDSSVEPKNPEPSITPKPTFKPTIVRSTTPRSTTVRSTTVRPTTVRPTNFRPHQTNRPTSKPHGRRNYVDEVKHACGKNPKDRIVGGSDSIPGNWPWAVPILYTSSYKQQFCGASLISRRHVLTAAHCMQRLKPKDIFVRVGAYDIQSEDEMDNAYDVIKIAQHPQYNPNKKINDISILTLEKEVKFSHEIHPVCLPEQSTEDYVRDNVTVIGWGFTSFAGSSSSTLKEVKIPVWSIEDCQNALGKDLINDKQICAGLKEGGQDSCQGDSGGPLLKHFPSEDKFEVIGVVSWGNQCAEANQPGVYTKVNRYTKWIAEQTTM